MSGSELLREAGALVAIGWCQNAEARAPSGAAVDVAGGTAAEWSLLGALQAVTLRDSSTTIEDLREALTAIAALIDDPSLAHWNDVPERTAADVNTLLARAEKLASVAGAAA